MMNAEDQIRSLRAKIDQACQRVGREPSGVTLVGASKAQSVQEIVAFARAGLSDFGENYVQEMESKIAFLQAQEASLLERIRWHYIGRLQRRKIRKLIGLVTHIHSIESLSEVQEIDRRASEHERTLQGLLQIKLGGEASKGGLPPEHLAEILKSCHPLKHLKIVGLMSLPPYHEDTEAMRPYHRELRELRDAINQKAVYKEPLTELSMGMSGDFEVAIEEGATMVRIGTALFGERDDVKK